MPTIKQLKKICKTCTVEKPRGEFPIYKSGPKAGQLASASCILCDNKNNNARKVKPDTGRVYKPRTYYKMTPELAATQKSRWRKAKSERIRKYVASVLSGAKCTDCPETRAITFHFDHRNPATKSFSINDALKGSISLERVKGEIAKCDIVCASCHAVRTANMFGDWRLSITPQGQAEGTPASLPCPEGPACS